MSVNFDEIEEYLNKFDGGNVYISKEFYNEGIAIIYLDNPTKRNAFTGKMMVDLRKCILKLEQWSNGKAVIIRSSTSGFFCSGGDLSFAEASGNEYGAKSMSTWMQDTLNRLQNLSLFSVALIEGPTLGGGAELAIFCDFILACDNIKFSFVHGKMGIVTAWGGTTKLVQKIGPTKALDIVLSAEILTFKECLEYDIVQKVFAVCNFFDDSLKWIKQHCIHHFSITQKFKKIICNELLLEKEQNIFIDTWGSDLNKLALKQRVKHLK